MRQKMCTALEAFKDHNISFTTFHFHFKVLTSAITDLEHFFEIYFTTSPQFRDISEMQKILRVMALCLRVKHWFP